MPDEHELSEDEGQQIESVAVIPPGFDHLAQRSPVILSSVGAVVHSALLLNPIHGLGDDLPAQLTAELSVLAGDRALGREIGIARRRIEMMSRLPVSHLLVPRII